MVGFYSEIVIRIAIFLYALWIGGLATTIYNRVPNNIPIGVSHKPRCNNCKKEIRFKYFFPVLGYFLSNGKCINCGMKIPKTYLFIELSILFYILMLSATFDTFDERFISKSLYGSFLIILIFIYKTYKQIESRLIWAMVAFILAYRGYNHCLPDVIGLFVSCVISFLTLTTLQKHLQIKNSEFITCTVLMASLGYIMSFAFLVLVFLYKTICLISFFKFKKNVIKNADAIFFITIITALIATLVQ